ncbi:RDD family protein [Niallia sp. XMNu-256]|uniref:RDD family protein n=2 Tax=Niallia sp. XMNu-256 TaxID=3082444 RepID=UPI0030D10BA2
MNEMNGNQANNEKEKEPVYEQSQSIPIDEGPLEVNKQSNLNKIDQLELKYAGFWMRFWAYLLDIVIVGSINRILVYPLFRLFDLPVREASMFAPVSIITAIIFYAYFVLMTKYFGQTLGKMVFGLKVISLQGQKLNWSTVMFREWVGRFISGTILILYIVVGFLPKKQGVHDLFADTTVIHERS